MKKRILSLALAFLLTLGVTIQVAASGSPDETYTLTLPENVTVGDVTFSVTETFAYGETAAGDREIEAGEAFSVWVKTDVVSEDWFIVTLSSEEDNITPKESAPWRPNEPLEDSRQVWIDNITMPAGDVTLVLDVETTEDPGTDPEPGENPDNDLSPDLDWLLLSSENTGDPDYLMCVYDYQQSGGVNLYTMTLTEGDPVDGEYYAMLTDSDLMESPYYATTRVYTGHYDTAEAAEGSGNEITDEIFAYYEDGNVPGYPGDYSDGLEFTVVCKASDDDTVVLFAKYVLQTLPADSGGTDPDPTPDPDPVSPSDDDNDRDDNGDNDNDDDDDDDDDNRRNSGVGFGALLDRASNTPVAVTTQTAASAVSGAVSAAQAAGAETATATLKNPGEIPLATLRSMAAQTDMPLRLNADSMSKDGRSVEVRIILDPSQSERDLNLSASTTSSSAGAVEDHFERFFTNDVMVVDYGHKDSFGQTVDVAVMLDSALDAANLVFYSYNTSTNTYTLITDAAYWVDANGYVHFKTGMGDKTIISDGALAK